MVGRALTRKAVITTEMFYGRVRILALALSLLQRFDSNTANANEKGQQHKASV